MNRYKHGNTSIFTSSSLKILACIFMLIDHIGVKIFPDIIEFRLIGRLAYPIFAYFIAEGCKYTKNKQKRLITILMFGIICEIIYFLYSNDLYGNILLTFTLSVALIYGVQYSKEALLKKHYFKAFLTILIALQSVYIVTKLFSVDYGFYGVIAPVFPALLDYKAGKTPEFFKKLDNLQLRLVAFTFGLLLVSLQYGIYSIQIFSLLAIPLLALYNGKQGCPKLKYLFYIFYPLHLILLEIIVNYI